MGIKESLISILGNYTAQETLNEIKSLRQFMENVISETKDTARAKAIKNGLTDDDFNKIIGFIESNHFDEKTELMKNIDGIIHLYIIEGGKPFDRNTLDKVIEDSKFFFSRLKLVPNEEKFKVFDFGVNYLTFSNFKNLVTYKNYADFTKVIKKLSEKKSKSETSDAILDEGAKLVSKEGTEELRHVTTNEAMCKLGRADTGWCIARPSSVHWENYEKCHKFVYIDRSKPFHGKTRDDEGKLRDYLYTKLAILIRKDIPVLDSVWDMDDNNIIKEFKASL